MSNTGFIEDSVNLTTGWWAEFYLFYVPLRTLAVADTMRTAIIDPAANMNAINAAADVKWYHQAAGRPSWVYECYRTVVAHYFREEGETWNNYVGSGGYSVAQITGHSWLDSAMPASALPAPGAGDSWSQAWNVFAGLRNSKLTTSTYEEYLAMQGVEAPPLLRETQDDFKKPELIRFVRDFSYPRTAINPTDGSIGTNLQWAQADRIDKGRFFDEPGFLLGLQVYRPKAYLKNQRTAAADVLLNTAEGWLPPQFDQEPHTSIVMFPAGSAANSLVHGNTVDYWVDRRDLFLYGDQFFNIDMATADGSQNVVALPALDLGRRKYPLTTDQSMYPDMQSDGVISLQIASRIGVDLTTAG